MLGLNGRKWVGCALCVFLAVPGLSALAGDCSGRCSGGSNHLGFCLTNAECPGVGAVCNQLATCIHLEWRPAVINVPTNGIAEVGLYAVTDREGVGSPPATIDIESMSVILDWLPSRLQLMGISDPCRTCLGGPNAGNLCTTNADCPSSTCAAPDNCFQACPPSTYNWFVSSFPSDCGTDGLNAPCTGGLPTNDGDALYQAFSQLECQGEPAPSAQATPQGLLITKFRFKMLATSGGALLDIPLEAGDNTRTLMVGGDDPGLNIIGFTGNPAQFNVGAACDPPTASAVGPRYIKVSPASGSTAVALVVKGSPTNSTVSCITRYAQSVTKRCVGGSNHDSACTTDANCPGATCVSHAVLGTTPVYQTPSAWGNNIMVHSEVLGPNIAYQVLQDCGVTPGVTVSTAVNVTTWKWGDTNNNGSANFADISKTLDGFRLAFSASVRMEEVDLSGPSCLPNWNISFVDVSAAVNAFQGIPFQFCSTLCP